MRRLVLGSALVALLSALVGCHGPACRDCGHAYGKSHFHGGHGLVARHGQGHGAGGGYGGGGYGGVLPGGGVHYRPPTEPAGGPVPQYAYPYYTVRGPRDFLVDNPPSIGPY